MPEEFQIVVVCKNLAPSLQRETANSATSAEIVIKWVTEVKETDMAAAKEATKEAMEAGEVVKDTTTMVIRTKGTIIIKGARIKDITITGIQEASILAKVEAIHNMVEEAINHTAMGVAATNLEVEETPPARLIATT